MSFIMIVSSTEAQQYIVRFFNSVESRALAWNQCQKYGLEMGTTFCNTYESFIGAVKTLEKWGYSRLET
jgi:hypothetical protein